MYATVRHGLLLCICVLTAKADCVTDCVTSAHIRRYQLKPDFLVNEVNRYFRCTVVLPSNSRTTGATGERKSLLAEGDLCTCESGLSLARC